MQRVNPEADGGASSKEKSDQQPVETVDDPDADDFCTEAGKKTITYKITEKMAYHPIKICCCMFIFILVVSMTTVVLGVATTSKASEYDWVIADTEESKNLDALDDAKSRVDMVSTTVSERANIHDDKFYYLFESSDGSDLYSAANLLHMCKVESTMLTADGWSDVCHLVNGTCALPDTSIVVYFYEFQSVDDWNCTLLSESHVNDMKKPIYDGLATPAGQEAYGIWLSSNAADLGYSTMCNSIWNLGTPLLGYESDTDRKEEQFEEYQEFFTSLDGSVEGLEAELFDMFSIDDNADGVFAYYPTPYMSEANSSPSLRVYWFSVFNLQNEFIRMLASDLFFAIFSILFVVFWLRIHTGSTLMALSGIFMIVMSLPFTILIYKKIFNIPYYSEIHSLTLFIVLGVGADDIFVLNDSWKLAKHTYPTDITNGRNREVIHRRLLKCYRHTMSTVFNTSFTTSMAFIATGLSPLMPIATFGWFAATCIVCNYVFVITLMPPVAIISEMYFENACLPCQEKKQPLPPSEANPAASASASKSEPDYNSVPVEKGDTSATGGVELTTAAANNEGEETVLGQGGEDQDQESGVVVSGGDNNAAQLDTAAPEVLATEASDTSGHGSVTKKILDGYINFLEFGVQVGGCDFRVAAIFIMISLFAFGIVGMIYGLQLETPTSQETWFPDRHMLQESQTILSTGFLGFDDSSYEEISLNLGIAGIDRSDFNEYIPADNRGAAKFDANFELAQPMCQKAMVRMCEDIPKFECGAKACKPTGLIARANTTECFMADFREWSSATLGVDTYTMNETYFYQQLAEFRTETVWWQEDIGFIGGDLKYATVRFTSTMESEEPMQGKLDVQDCIEGLIRQVYNYEECNSCDCRSIMFSSPYAFTWMRSEIGLVRGFYQGMYIAFPVAFCVLLFATGNILIALYAILSVLFIVFGVLGFANYALHWDLGVAESIAGIIIIGFSVDYTVHLGHMYTDAEKQLGYTDRKSKFEHSSREIAPTVVGGAITTAGAGCFMFLCQMLFFVKMAALIVSTIVLSYIYSLGFFMSMLLVIGPERDQGKVSVYVDWVKAKLNMEGQSKEQTAKKVNTEDEELKGTVE